MLEKENAKSQKNTELRLSGVEARVAEVSTTLTNLSGAQLKSK